jgi:GT2 family glycosyltransferase
VTSAAASPTGQPTDGQERASVAVVIVTYNSGHFVDRCLESIARCSELRSLIHVTIVDNNSTDGTTERLRGFEGLRLSIIENERNLGFAGAVNRGLAATQSEFVLLLNPDTVLPPGVVDSMVEFMAAHPEAGIASPKLVLQDGSIDPACHRGFPTPWASVCYFAGLERLFPRFRLVNGYHRWDLPLDREHEIDAVSGAFLFARRSVLEQIGGLDERFFMYGEDIDACLRARQLGHRVYFVPQETVLHVKGTSAGIHRHSFHASPANRATRFRTLNAFHDSMLLFYDKHYADRYPRLVGGAMRAGIGLRRRLTSRRLARAMKDLQGGPPGSP